MPLASQDFRKLLVALDLPEELDNLSQCDLPVCCGYGFDVNPEILEFRDGVTPVRAPPEQSHRPVGAPTCVQTRPGTGGADRGEH